MARLLGPADRPALEAFLDDRPDTTMFLRSNLRQGGLVDHGERYQGTWCAAFDGDAVVAVAACFWNGVVVLSAPSGLAEVVRGAVEGAPRDVSGLIGPLAEVTAARDVLGSAAARVQHESVEDLFTLSLDALQIPEALAEDRVQCRRPTAAELPVLADWRAAYMVETFGAERDETLERNAETDVRSASDEGRLFVLTDGDRLVGTSAFNATLPDCVQVGGVYTPPELRSRGHARSVVAGSLDLARKDGVGRSILFTENTNHAARRAYEAIGFRVVGDYAIVLFGSPA